MKRYLKPNVRLIDLDTEGVIAGSLGEQESLSVDLSDDNAGGDQFSNKKSIWKTDHWLE